MTEIRISDFREGQIWLSKDQASRIRINKISARHDNYLDGSYSTCPTWPSHGEWDLCGNSPVVNCGGQFETYGETVYGTLLWDPQWV
jgi:hypothetical protein